MTASECPQRHLHADGPKGYLEWHAFAEEMAATHVQEPCTGLCGKLIWVPTSDVCVACAHPVAHHDDPKEPNDITCMVGVCECRRLRVLPRDTPSRSS